MRMEPRPNPTRARAKKPVTGSTPVSETAKTRKTPHRISVQPVTASDDLHQRIQQRAYELYERRGYGHGLALEDWLQAEREILSQVPPT